MSNDAMGGENSIEIKKGDIATVIELARLLPEFEEAYGVEEYQKRLVNVQHLILVAFIGAKAVGFKVGYEKGVAFYSWMGGVLPGYRRLGVAACPGTGMLG